MPEALHFHVVKIGDGSPDEQLLVKRAAIDTASAGDTTIVAAVSGRKIRVIGIKFSVAGDVTVTWKSGSTALSGAETFKSGGGISDYWGPHGYFFETVAGQALVISLGGAVQVSGWINYLEV